MSAVSFNKLDETQRSVFATPLGFARGYLKMPLSPAQEQVLASFGPTRARVSTVCCNEAGKTTKLITALILWHLTAFRRKGENGGVITTSGSWDQILRQLGPALRSYAHMFPKWDFLEREIKIDGVPNWMAFSTTEVGRAEGFHGSPENPLLALVDEAKSVRDDIFRTIEDRCRPQRIGYFSSPGYSMGEFYESHTGKAAFYTRHKITYEDCHWIDRVDMERIVRKAGDGDYDKGLTDPLVRSAYFAEFMPYTEDALLTLADIEECLADPPQVRPGERHVFCDFAAGGDENVIGVRVGNRVWIADAWREKNTMSGVGRFLVNFNKLKSEQGLRPGEIEGDADGMGRVMIDRIREAGWPILDFHNNAASFEPDKFKNRASEVWFNGAQAIIDRKVRIPQDPMFNAQIIDRQGKFESSGLRWIESKKDLFARQVREGRPKRSPDRADAILGAMGRLPLLDSVSTLEAREQGGPWANDPDIGAEHTEHMSIPEEVLRGFDAGS